MQAVDWIIIAVIAVIIGLAAFYVIKAKKSGKKCIGCPADCLNSCQGSCNGCSGCNKNS